MRRRAFDFWIGLLLTLVCVGACALFTFLPFKVFDTSLVYQGF